MEEKLITIAEYESYIEADMASQTLADFDIKAVVTGDNSSNIYSGISAVAKSTVQVFESQAEQAKEILAKAQGPADEMLEQPEELQEEE